VREPPPRRQGAQEPRQRMAGPEEVQLQPAGVRALPAPHEPDDERTAEPTSARESASPPPSVSPKPSPVDGRSSTAEARRAPPRLEDIFPNALPRKRTLPRSLKLGLGAFVLVLCAAVGASHRGDAGAPAAAVIEPVKDDLVVSAEALRHRREVKAEDFMARRSSSGTAPNPHREGRATVVVDEKALTMRRARREHDPDDVLRLRRAGSGAAPPPDTAEGRPARDERVLDVPAYVTASEKETSANAADPSRSRRSARTLGMAGASLEATLITPVELRSGSATVVARLEKGHEGLPAGTRFVGAVRSAGDRLDLSFHKAILPDGRIGLCEAQAQAENGAFGLAGEDVFDGDQSPAVAGEVARDVAEDALSSTVGTGLLGTAVSSTLRSTRASGSLAGRSSTRRTWSVAAGTPLRIFLHEPVKLE
jgi:hypothetical protein